MPLTLLKQRLGVGGLWWSGRRESNPHGQLGRLRSTRGQGPRPAEGRGHSYRLLTVVYRG
jgi:hypothetical protein